jgi:16S rRNA (uracil1498-N3)-methyltransferase
MKNIRIFTSEKNLCEGLEIKIINGDFEYLSKVMRQKIGNEILIFNGIDGEFKAAISAIEKKFISVKILQKTSELKKVPPITLAFALIKNVRIDFIAAKATELGLASFQPLITRHTIVDKLNFERFNANIKEAVEQCERNDFPQLLEVKKLDKFLAENDVTKKILILCDESHQAAKASKVLAKIAQEKISANKEIVILVGPEGGFSAEEFTKMRALKNLFAISLGPRILRADTAIISALTLVQEFLGDFC